jgi:malate permease and related proteins
MTAYVAAFINNILPIIIAAGVGFLLGRKTDVQPGTLSKVVLYVFIPCLIYQLVTANAISDRDILLMMGFTVVLMVLVTAVMGGLGKAFGWPKSIIAAAMLASLATNSGNYGLTLTQFAFGDRALPYASLFMVDNSLVTYTLGIAIAAWGTGKASNPLAAPFKYPFIYAFIIGLVVSHLHVSLPQPVDRVVNLFAAASIPTMLLLLGMQLNLCEWHRPTLALTLTNLTRLVTSPVIALGLAALFTLQGPARQAGILQAAMPTAVTAILLGTEFELEPTFLTVTVAFSTILSFITLTPLIVYLS